MMRISFRSETKKLRLYVPNALLTGKLLAAVIVGDKNDKALQTVLTPQTMRTLRRGLKEYVKAYGHFTLFRCESEDVTVEDRHLTPMLFPFSYCQAEKFMLY